MPSLMSLKKFFFKFKIFFFFFYRFFTCHAQLLKLAFWRRLGALEMSC